MKKIMCILLASVLLLSSLFVFASCEAEDTGDDEEENENENKEDNKEDNENNKEDENKEPTLPEGYTLYDNGEICFAYPAAWVINDSSVVILTSESGNNITVAYESKSDFYKNMTADEFMSVLGPQFEAMGQSVSNVKVEQLTNDLGTAVTKISLNNTYMEIAMVQTMYVIAAGVRNYVVTVTEVTSDSTLVNTVFETLCESK